MPHVTYSYISITSEAKELVLETVIQHFQMIFHLVFSRLRTPSCHEVETFLSIVHWKLIQNNFWYKFPFRMFGTTVRVAAALAVHFVSVLLRLVQNLYLLHPVIITPYSALLTLFIAFPWKPTVLLWSSASKIQFFVQTYTSLLRFKIQDLLKSVIWRILNGSFKYCMLR